MILVDSSVWVNFFQSSPGRAGAELRRMIDENHPFAITGVVVSEVLQGLSRDAGPIERFLAACDMLNPTGFETYRNAAALFRTARSRGISLTTIDTLIAAVAIEHRASVFTLDRDFARMARIIKLVLYEF